LDFSIKEEVLKVKALMRENQEELNKQASTIQANIDERFAKLDSSDEKMEMLAADLKFCNDTI